MKLQTKSQWLLCLLAIFFVAGCASTPLTLDDKYVFTQYQQVDKFSNYSLDNWEAIDRQSLIVQTSPSQYYLLVLNRPVTELRFAQTISLSSTGSSVYAKIDCVNVESRGCGPDSISAVIHSIYKLEGKEDVRAVKSQITSE